jgi:hypothetical protein
VNPLYPAVAERAGERCEYCRAPEQVFNFAFEVEHIQPRSGGGNNSMDNLALACESCNLFKSDATTGYDEIEARNVLLYHPRYDLWDEHFRFDSETGKILGLTAIGRTTVARLKMNSAFQLRARQHWTRSGLYP